MAKALQNIIDDQYPFRRRS